MARVNRWRHQGVPAVQPYRPLLTPSDLRYHWQHCRGERQASLQDLRTFAFVRDGGDRALRTLHVPCRGTLTWSWSVLSEGGVPQGAPGIRSRHHHTQLHSRWDGSRRHLVRPSLACIASRTQCFNCVNRGADSVRNHLSYAPPPTHLRLTAPSDTPRALLLFESSLPVLHRQLHRLGTVVTNQQPRAARQTIDRSVYEFQE